MHRTIGLTKIRRNVGRLFHPVTALPILTLALGGCFGETPSNPDPVEEAPIVPAAERLTFNLGFFESNTTVTERSASKQNFFNAYVRAVTVGAITHLILEPPVTAFALALNTVPSPQSDGSYLWVYTFVNGAEEAQIRLRGLPLQNGRVEWQMRVSNNTTNPPVTNALWIEGETWKDGNEGDLEFYDFEQSATEVAARLEWGADTAGEFLRFTDLNENIGDQLELRGHGDDSKITYVDADQPTHEWFVKWNEATGTGSMKDPAYRDGVESCWDEHQNDVECNVPAL